jgi:hypothetical protein
MKDFHKKEKPLQGISGWGGGATGLRMAGVADKTKYIDEVFSTYVYAGNGGANQITNNIDNSKGGLVWMKNRDRSTYASNLVFDTERGSTKYILTDAADAEATSGAGTGINTFNDDGFTLQGNGYGSNYNTEKFVSWNFRKQKGFLDIVTYSGNGVSGRTISHGLGSVPGLIMIKSTTDATSWFTYHRDLGPTKYLMLNHVNAEATQSWFMNDTAPTATEFTLGHSTNVNGSGRDYVAYVFAGGSSTAATATSVDLDGTGDYLSTPDYNWISNFSFGTGDFTVEGWFKWDNNASGLFQIAGTGGLTSSYFEQRPCVWMSASDTFSFNANNAQQTTDVKGRVGQWTHVAYVRHNNKTSLYVNGTIAKRVTDNQDYGGFAVAVGGYWSTSYLFDGKISNFRIVKGTAVYTDSFKPPTEPLTNITGTELLCCQGSTATAATVLGSGGSLTANGDPTADTTDSPFDDPDGFKFGADENQNIVKVGKWIGNGMGTGTFDGTIVNTGWEPQWLLVKNTDLGTEPWMLMDSMRGIPSMNAAAGDQVLYPTYDSAEATINNLDTTANGFRCTNADDKINGSGHSYIYMAIRMPDGVVGKPADAGTDVFTMVTGNSSSTIPTYVSGFPVDFALQRKPANAFSWDAVSRLTSSKYVQTNDNGAAATYSPQYSWDSNTGWAADSGCDANFQSWMWKRGQGFDVVAYHGDPKGVLPDKCTPIPHSLNAVPEMIWTKGRNSPSNWSVYHKGLNGGTNPEQYYLELDNTNQEATQSNRWNDTAPTSTHFFVGDNSDTGATSDDYIAMLFASANDADGNPISKVGSYDGSNSEQTITTGFQPRFLIIKRVDAGYAWFVLDTTRGWGSGSDSQLQLNDNQAEQAHDFGAPTATGFTLTSFDSYNISGGKFIYYAHA